MTLARRSFLKSAGLVALATPFARQAFAEDAAFAPAPGALRTFELTTRIALPAATAPTRVWVPVPSQDLGDWFKAHGSSVTGNAARSALKTDPGSGARYVEASWDAGTAPNLEVVSRVSTRDRAVDPSRATDAKPLSRAERAAWLRPTRYMPLDGVVKQTSDEIVAGAHTDVEKVRAIYEWVVDNTYRNGATAGCGAGDVVAFMKTRPMGGKCADINGLFVALVRSQGIPARDIYGIRVAPSKFGYRSLGANTETVTKSQHCRAEVYLSGVGWTPMDPADVRKVALEEPPGHLDMASAKVAAARKTLFGAWETNWLAYNTAQDVRLSGSDGAAVPFLMYPQAEIGAERVDCLQPDKAGYTITAREIVS